MCVSPEKPEPVAASGYRREPDRMLASPFRIRAGASADGPVSRRAFTLKVWPGGLFRPFRQLHAEGDLNAFQAELGSSNIEPTRSARHYGSDSRTLAFWSRSSLPAPGRPLRSGRSWNTAGASLWTRFLPINRGDFAN